MSSEVSAAFITGGFGILLAVVAYFGGRIRAEHEIRYSQLYQRKADVVATLHAHFYDLEQSVRSLTNPFGFKGEPTKLEKLRETGSQFRQVRQYYHHNSLWLDEDISKKIETFLDQMYAIWDEFEVIGMALGLEGFDNLEAEEWRITYEETFGEMPRKGWSKLAKRVKNDVPPLREELRAEFRKLLGIRKTKIAWTEGFAGP